MNDKAGQAELHSLQNERLVSAISILTLSKAVLPPTLNTGQSDDDHVNKGEGAMAKQVFYYTLHL